MHTVTVRRLLDPVRIAVIPARDPFIKILLGQEEGKTATSSMTQRNAILAIDDGTVLHLILAGPRFLELYAKALGGEVSTDVFGHLGRSFVERLPFEQSLLFEQRSRGPDRRDDLNELVGVGVCLPTGGGV